MANRIKRGCQHTVTWHVDDLKSSHVNPKVNDKFLSWLENKYANDKIGKIKATRGKTHDYLAITMDFNITGVLKIDMAHYIEKMIQEFLLKLLPVENPSLFCSPFRVRQRVNSMYSHNSCICCCPCLLS